MRGSILTFLVLFCWQGLHPFRLFGQGAQAKAAESSVIVVEAPRPFTVVIDPGHGGRDPGQLGSAGRMHEKEIVLAIALQLGQYIEERIKGVSVLYTRTTDTEVSLDERVEIANQNKADFFISIHCNATSSASVRGTQSHIQSHSFEWSRKLALAIEKEFSHRAGRKSQGVFARSDRGHNFQVLQYTEMPGVLVEAGFMSNPDEEKFLNTPRGQDLIASAVFRALRDIIMKNPDISIEKRTPYYKIQIMASSRQEITTGEKFRKLGMRVDEIIDEQPGTLRFRYMVGREYEKHVAQALAQKVQQLGFKDAFVVEFNN